MTRGGFIDELRRRHVFRTAGLYVVAAWGALQVAELALAGLGIPETAIRYVWIGAFAGFPLALLFSWRYEVTRNGIIKTPPAGGEPVADLALRIPDYAILAALVTVAALVTLELVREIREVEGPAVAATGINPNSIAVLPLVNVTGNPDQDYFAAGMHDALITSLSRVRDLRVTSRTSTLRVDQELLTPEIAQRLGVARVLEGSVAREGDQVRIIVQLIDAASDENLWAQSYERTINSVLSLQNEIARAVADAVKIRLSSDEEARLPVNLTVNPETYDAYLRGMYQMHQETPKAYRRGIEILDEAVEKDPDSALAWAGLAYGYAKLGHSPFPVEGAYPNARDAALKALELDPDLAEAHLAVAMFKVYYEWNWPAAEKAYKTALDINPSLVAAHYHYAWLLELLNRKKEALYHGEITRELAPLSPFYTGWLADQYVSSGLYERALETVDYTFELSPDYPVAWLVLGEAYMAMGRPDDAIAAHENLRDSPFWSWVLASTLARAGYLENAQAILGTLDPGDPLPFAVVHASMDNVEEAFEWLDACREARVPWYPWLVAWFPHTEPLRVDSRMQELADRLNLDLPASG